MHKAPRIVVMMTSAAVNAAEIRGTVQFGTKPAGICGCVLRLRIPAQLYCSLPLCSLRSYRRPLVRSSDAAPVDGRLGRLTPRPAHSSPQSPRVNQGRVPAVRRSQTGRGEVSSLRGWRRGIRARTHSINMA